MKWRLIACLALIMACLAIAWARLDASDTKAMGVFDPEELRLVKTDLAIALFSKDRILTAQYHFDSGKDRNDKYDALVKLREEERKAKTPLRVDR